jgi:hypothetical protein
LSVSESWIVYHFRGFRRVNLSCGSIQASVNQSGSSKETHLTIIATYPRLWMVKAVIPLRNAFPQEPEPEPPSALDPPVNMILSAWIPLNTSAGYSNELKVAYCNEELTSHEPVKRFSRVHWYHKVTVKSGVERRLWCLTSGYWLFPLRDNQLGMYNCEHVSLTQYYSLPKDFMS